MKDEITVDVGVKSIFEYLDIKDDDVVLYLGGRIDDENLYPKKYSKYLRDKIDNLKPTKIICHSHWYASRYFSKKILDEKTKVDLVIVYHPHFMSGKCQPINPELYEGKNNEYLDLLLENNPEIIFATYNCPKQKRVFSKKINAEVIQKKSLELHKFFEDKFNLKNFKSFSFPRKLYIDSIVDLSHEPVLDLSRLSKKDHINATDGFAIINGFVSSGFKNLNIAGFTAFGMNEEKSNFTPYSNKYKDVRFKGKNYFEIKTSESQILESEILKNYVDQGRIFNLEDYDMLLRYLK